MTAAAEIQLRPYAPADAPALYEAARESSHTVGPWLPWCHPAYTLADAERWIATETTRPDLHEFAIVAADGRFLGGCGLNAIRRQTQTANLGYWVRATACGRGIAARAVGLLCRWARQSTPLRRIEALIPTDNTASLRVMEKCGATLEGPLPRGLTIHGVRHEAVVYVVTLR